MESIDRLLERHGTEQRALIPLLLEIQRENNYLPREMLEELAERMKLPPIQLFQVASFYKAFSLKPRGKHLIRVCLGTACHVRGAQQVLEAIKGKLQIEPGQTSKDGKFTLETVNCLGTCALAPVVTIDSKYSGNMTPPKVNQALKPYQ